MKEIAHGIVVDEQVRFGKPIIAGTRVPADLVMAKMASGMTIEEIMREYALQKEDVHNVLDYAAKVLGNEQIKVYP